MSSIKNDIQYIGNIVKNVAEEKEDIFKLEPDIESKGKITKLLSKFVITPNVVVDEKLKYMDPSVFKDLVKTEMITFTSLVTNAIRIMVEQYGVTPTVAIDKVSNSTLKDDIATIYDLVSGNNSASYDYIKDVIVDDNEVLPAIAKDSKDNKLKSGSLSHQNLFKDMSSFINSYELALQFETNKGNIRVVTIPIIVYPNIVFDNAEALINDRFGKESSTSILDAFNDYSTGLQSLYDIIFAVNIVKEYRERKLTSKSIFSKYLNMSDKTSFIKDIIHNRNSFSKNFNIYIFDTSIEAKLNRLIKGSILKYKYKQKAMAGLMAFSITLVDNENEEITYLIDDMEGFSVLKFNMLKKEKESDMVKVVKEMLNNRTPF